MNFSNAVRRSLRRPLQSIHSAADTELGRKLTNDELNLLSNRFALDDVFNYIEKV